MRNYLDADAKKDGAFHPETVRLLIAAFDDAWETIAKSGVTQVTSDNTQETRDKLAKRIIELARLGERDPRLLRDNALLQFSQSSLRDAPRK